jgi:AbrB family looped-hinge helix DNA binding protein
VKGEFDMPNSIMSTKGQVTIPLKIRKKLGLVAGTPVSFIPYKDTYILSVPETDPVYALAGSLKYDGRALSTEDMDAAIESSLKEKWQGQ